MLLVFIWGQYEICNSGLYNAPWALQCLYHFCLKTTYIIQILLFYSFQNLKRSRQLHILSLVLISETQIHGAYSSYQVNIIKSCHASAIIDYKILKMYNVLVFWIWNI